MTTTSEWCEVGTFSETAATTVPAAVGVCELLAAVTVSALTGTTLTPKYRCIRMIFQ
jgi:hypothetical protein